VFDYSLGDDLALFEAFMLDNSCLT